MLFDISNKLYRDKSDLGRVILLGWLELRRYKKAFNQKPN